MVSPRARFAIHGLAFLATRPAGESVSFTRVFTYLRSWSDRLVLSKGYVSKIFQDLSRAGLVRAVPGRSGGYRLAGDPREVSLLDVLRVMDGVVPNECCLLADGACSFQARCGVLSVIDEAQQAFYRVLAGTSLAEMARRLPHPTSSALQTEIKHAF